MQIDQQAEVHLTFEGEGGNQLPQWRLLVIGFLFAHRKITI